MQQKIARRREVLPGEAPELEDQDRHMTAIRGKQLRERIIEQLGVQEMLVLLPR